MDMMIQVIFSTLFMELYNVSRYGFRPNSSGYFVTQTHVTTGTKQTKETLTKAKR